MFQGHECEGSCAPRPLSPMKQEQMLHLSDESGVFILLESTAPTLQMRPPHYSRVQGPEDE